MRTGSSVGRDLGIKIHRGAKKKSGTDKSDYHTNLAEATDDEDEDAVDRDWNGQECKRGGGGLWRTFVNEKTFGSKGRPDFAELGGEFRLLSEEEKERIRHKSEQATAAHRAAQILLMARKAA